VLKGIAYEKQKLNPDTMSNKIATENQQQLKKLFYTVEEAAEVLSVSVKSIRRWIDRQLLTCSNASRKKLIPCEQVEAFVKATCPPQKINGQL
jgi:excisionase family DNA binding protein